MTNKHSTKKALFMSMLSILLCLTMLVGSTFAWFTDTASTGVNTIVAGNLDAELEYSIDCADWKEAGKDNEIFNGVLWEPGHTEVAYFKVINKGSLAFDYKVTTNVVKEVEGTNVEGNPFKLSDYLQFGIVETDAKFPDRAAARAAVTVPNKFSNVENGEKRLEAGTAAAPSEEIFAMVVWMPEETGNVANYKTGTTKPEIQFGVQVLAYQANVEKDSFDENYDKDSEEPAGPKLDAIVAAPKTAAEFAGILTTALTGGSASGTITINLEDDFDFNNEWTTINGANYSGVNTVVINGNGHSIKNLNQPLMEGVFGGTGTMTIKNLTIKDSVVSAAGGKGVGIGVFMNNADTSNSVTFENCKIENVTITNTADDSTLGGFIGYSSAATLTLTNCSVTGSKFYGTKDIGAFVGYTQSAVTATNAVITSNTIESSNTSTYRVGAIAGTFNVNSSTITTSNVSDNTIKQENAADMSKHTSDYAGRIYADVTVDGVALPKN